MSEPKKTPFRRSVRIGENDTDPAGRLSAAAMARILQGTAADHAEALGCGMAALKEKGALWVVTRMSLVIEELPRLGEEVFAETWPGKTRHMLFPRYYAMRDGAGRTLLRGAGMWMLIHPDSRKMCFPEEIGLAVPDMSRGDELPMPDRRIAFPEELPRSARRRVQDAELDFNGHLNNAWYFAWSEALLPEAFFTGHQLREIWIEYRKELLPHAEAELRWTVEGDTLYVKGLQGEEEHFRLRMSYGTI